jgi:hypothetical protein
MTVRDAWHAAHEAYCVKNGLDPAVTSVEMRLVDDRWVVLDHSSVMRSGHACTVVGGVGAGGVPVAPVVAAGVDAAREGCAAGVPDGAPGRYGVHAGGPGVAEVGAADAGVIWRVGSKVGKTVYRRDVLVGVMFEAEDAEFAVWAMNRAERIYGGSAGGKLRRDGGAACAD